MMIATMEVMPAPPMPDMILPTMICSSELAVPLIDVRRQVKGLMIHVKEVRHQTYEMSDPTPNRQYATNIGILRPKLSLVAPY